MKDSKKVIRFFSDLHINHTKIYETRGFSTVSEMNKHIIASWNSVVSENDTTIVCGDLSLTINDFKFLFELNGDIIWVLGNHDTLEKIKTVSNLGLNDKIKILGCYEFIDKELNLKIICSHFPIHEYCMERYDLNIHGHIHTSKCLGERYVNVTPESIGYKPLTLKELLAIQYAGIHSTEIYKK